MNSFRKKCCVIHPNYEHRFYNENHQQYPAILQISSLQLILRFKYILKSGFTFKTAVTVHLFSSPVNCSAGWQPNAEMTNCIRCPEGHYKSKAGRHLCQVCPKNRTTLEDGALMRKECIGMYSHKQVRYDTGA